jgi:hypothetical protein
MPGKLPIDRVRASEHAPAIYKRDKERFTEKRARLEARGGPGMPPETGQSDTPPEGEADDGEEAQEPEPKDA